MRAGLNRSGPSSVQGTVVTAHRLSIAHAYTPNEQASYGGGDHLVVEAPLDAGRIHRQRGDALCRPRHKFWGLTATEFRGQRLCPKCVAIATRLGLSLPE